MRVAIVLISLLASAISEHLISGRYVRKERCAADRSGDVTSYVVSTLQCATLCSLRPACTGFNVIRTSGVQSQVQCDIFLSRVFYFTESTNSCKYYEIKDPPWKQVCADPVGGISGDQCSFPFTLNGSLNYRCALDSTGCHLGCFVENRVWTPCTLNTAFLAENVTVEVETGPAGGSTAQPLPSVHGWLTWMQRFSASPEFVNHDWLTYRNGFGTIDGNSSYWLGLERIHYLTTGSPGGAGSRKMRIELQSSWTQSWYSAEYESFWLEDGSHGYTLHATGYTGDAGDGVSPPGKPDLSLNGMPFSTTDRDQDGWSAGNCAHDYGGGQWYRNCASLCLTYQGKARYGPLYDLGLAPGANVDVIRVMMKQK